MVILDDYRFYKKTGKQNFLRVCNYTLRHNSICLILICHNLFHNELYTQIIYAPHLFISYSNVGHSIIRYFLHDKLILPFNKLKPIDDTNQLYCRKLSARLGGKNAVDFYQNSELQNYHFCYINSKKNFLINQVDNLLTGYPTSMFASGITYVIHDENKPCGQSLPTQTAFQLSEAITKFLNTTYPKQKLLPLVLNILLQKDLITDEFYFKDHNNVHIIDFCRYILNKFDKNDKPNPALKNLIKTLQANQVRFPNACISNPMAKKLLCW